VPEKQPKRAAADLVAAAGNTEKAGPLVPGLEPVDRRGSIRLPFSAAAEVTELESKAKISGRCSDVGFGGCYVDTMSLFPVSARVKLRLTKSNRSFEGEATVVYAQAGMGMGLAFTDMQADQFSILQQWIRELSGEPGPDLDSAKVPPAEQPPRRTERFVLNQLISLLIRKRLLTEAEGAALLRELFT
jgi:hypothetical protein